MVCCVKGCGKHLGWIDTPCGGTSHGYCRKHFAIEMQKFDKWYREQEALRQQKEE